MIVFLISASVVLRQNTYVNTEAMRVPVDQTVLITMPQCTTFFKDRIAALPGVKGAACAGMLTLAQGNASQTVMPRNGGAGLQISIVPVSAGYFELYGLKPLAGRFFRSDGSDDVTRDKPLDQSSRYVVDEAAVRQLGYKTAQEAVGKSIMYPGGGTAGTIIGVVKTFSLTVTGAKEMGPVMYMAGTAANNAMWNDLLHVKLTGAQIPETLAAIDAEWKKSGGLGPISRQFLDASIQSQQEYILREGQMFAFLSGIAMLLSCLGLFGITIATAVKRTKEIGVRKAMGASTLSVIALLLWQFAKPVLWANVIAWPLAFWAMNRWLSGFAAHVDLEAGAFIAASAVALGVALVTVAQQAILLARRAPVLALRYE
jgi:putative ABC transport system permease protein